MGKIDYLQLLFVGLALIAVYWAIKLVWESSKRANYYQEEASKNYADKAALTTTLTNVLLTKDLIGANLQRPLLEAMNDVKIDDKVLLTKREMEILELYLAGLTNVKVGEQLYISKHTVNRHLENIRKKTGCNNKTMLMAYATRNKLFND